MGSWRRSSQGFGPLFQGSGGIAGGNQPAGEHLGAGTERSYPLGGFLSDAAASGGGKGDDGFAGKIIGGQEAVDDAGLPVPPYGISNEYHLRLLHRGSMMKKRGTAVFVLHFQGAAGLLIGPVQIFLSIGLFRPYLVHGGLQVQIAMYQDRIEITSPGGLPDGISESAYLYSQISIPRNVIIAEVFHRLAIIEKFGTGIERIRLEYEGYADKPEFEVSTDLIRVVLPVINYEKLPEELSTEERILLFIGQNPMVARSKLEAISDLQRTRLTEMLNMLVKEGKIERFGAGRGVRYKIKLE